MNENTPGAYSHVTSDNNKKAGIRAEITNIVNNKLTELNSLNQGLTAGLEKLESIENMATYFLNVESMINSTTLKANNIACTLGYYSENDGGASTYIIKNTSLAQDLGSIITLTNGLQAHLLPKGFVNYRMFGAKLDGDIARVTNETSAIKNCHAYANTKDLPVIQNNGTITLNNVVTVQTDTDLAGCSILIKSYAKDKILYNITSKKPTIPVTSFTQSEMKMGVNQIPSLSQYKHHMITIESNELLSERNDGGTISKIKKKDSFFLTRDGAFVSGKLIQDFTTGTLTITARPYEEKKLVFKGPKVIWDFQNLLSTCIVVNLARGNANLEDMLLDIPNTIDYDDTTGGSYKSMAFNIRDAYKVKVSNIVAENITNGSTASGYIMNMSDVIDVTFDKVMWLNGWGATGTNNVKDWKVFDSQINRIDAHTGTGDLYCRNVKFIGGWGVFLGYGDGNIIIENCTSDFLDIDGRKFDTVVYIGVSYGVLFRGNIDIINHKIISRTSAPKHLVLFSFSGAGIDYKPSYDLKLPNLNARDIYFEGTGNEHLFGYAMKGLDTAELTLVNNNKYIILPSIIDISGVTLNIDNDKSYFQAVLLTMTNAIVAQRTKADNPKVRIKDIYQTVDSKFKNGFTTADLNISQLPKKLIWMIMPKDTAATAEFDINIDNSGGSVQIEVNTKTVKIINSEVSIDVEGVLETSANRLIVNDCDWYLFSSGAKTSSILQNTNLEAKGNTFYLTKKDGAVLPPVEYNLAGGAKKLHGNIFTDQSVSNALADKYWKYLDTTIYKSPTSL